MTRWGEFDDLHHIDELEEAESTKPENPPKGTVELVWQHMFSDLRKYI